MSRPRSPTLEQEALNSCANMNVKKCTGCKQLKNLKYFTYRNKTSGKLEARCSVCKKAGAKKYYDKNKQALRKKAMDRYNENRDKILAKRKPMALSEEKTKKRKQTSTYKYVKTPEQKAKRNKKARLKYKTDPETRLRRNLTGILGQFVRGINDRGSKYVGCSLAQYKAYIESKFEQGMTWSNRGQGEGKWSLSHEVNFETFKGQLHIYVKVASWYGNMKPMWFAEATNPSRRSKCSDEAKKNLIERYLTWSNAGKPAPMIVN